jgi:hypothetical protein
VENSSPTYRITTKSGIVIGNDLPRSAPAIQLQEGKVCDGLPAPVKLLSGQSTLVTYPLLTSNPKVPLHLVCKVERIDGITEVVQEKPQEQSKEEPIPEPVAVRRRGRRSAQ